MDWDPINKPSEFERLTDILEIMAVAMGRKPAHLNGQGFHSEALIGRLERMAKAFRLSTLRTLTIALYRYRAPNYDKAIDNWEREDRERHRKEQPLALWIYKEPELLPLIRQTVDGTISCSATLGYPECCVEHRGLSSVMMDEALVEGIKIAYHVETPEKIIELLREDVEVGVSGPSPRDQMVGSHTYVQFTACPVCVKRLDSEAGRKNRLMRDLAFSLSPFFGRAIWNTCYVEAGLMSGRGFPRNVRCPCGSGKKYKSCCDLVDPPRFEKGAATR